jgi:hypothetical protein
VKAVLPDAPVGANVMVPRGWEMTKDGIREFGGESGVSIPAPVLLVGRAQDINKHEELVTVAFPRNKCWQQRTVERVETADSRRVIGLANAGMPVTSNNARAVVQYLADFEAANLAALPLTRVSRQLGWQGKDGSDGFLLGADLVTAEGLVKADGSHGTVVFRGSDEGDEQLALGLCRHGTLAGWLDALEPVAHFPRVKLVLYASFAAPVLAITECPNPVLGLSGPTTGGKTVALRLAGSVWGNPDEASSNSFVHTWDGTPVWRERAPGTLRDLPLILDDTQRARRPQDVQQTIYDTAQGRGRGRGSPKGLARQSASRNTLLTTGEQPLASFTKAGGTHARTLELWGTPFGQKDQATGSIVRRLNRKVKRHYGHAGALFVQYLLQHRKERVQWRKEFRAYVTEYEDLAGDNVLAGRLADQFALLRLTARLVDEAIDLPWEFADPVEPLWEELVQEVGEADRSAAALRHVMDWAAAHQSEFCRPGSRDEEHRQPAGGWAGVWPPETVQVPVPGAKKTESQFIGFLPHRLNKILSDEGFDPGSTIRTWKDRGWIKVTLEDGVERTRCKVKIGGRPAWVIGITRDAVTAAQAG